jgi:hypothetical protein
MAKFAFSVPELPGKDARSVPAYLRKDMKGYLASRKRAGITMERVFLMPTPMGNFVTAYLEAAGDFGTTMGSFLGGDPFDKGFLDRVAEVHGFDMSKPPPGPPPELIAEWWDPAVKERRAGLAFMAPLKPGMDKAGRAFANEAFEKRKSELTASRRALRQRAELVFINSTPNGEIVCVYLEGTEPAAGNRAFAASKSPYDVWFKAECRKIFIDGIDFNVPLPPIEQIWDWRAA